MKMTNTHLWKWHSVIWLLIFGASCAHAIGSSTFDYDGKAQAQIDYDASGNAPVFGYDRRPLLAADENNRPSVVTRPLFGEFAEFLAAEGEIVAVTHFTDAATIGKIQNGTGMLNPGTFVTLPGEVTGMNAAQVEMALEIDAGKGAYSTDSTTQLCSSSHS
jgi:hypothetical protein